MKSFLLLIFVSLLVDHSAFAQTKIIDLPGENAGQTIQVEVIDRKQESSGYYRYETVAREQKIETSQLSLSLNRSPIYFHADNKFWGLMPAAGKFKGSKTIQAFNIRTQNAQSKCLLEMRDLFKVKRACAIETAVLTPKNQPTIATHNAELTMNEAGNVTFLLSSPNGAMLGNDDYFPEIQGISLTPGRNGIIDMRMGLTLDDAGFLTKIKGSVLSQGPFNLNSKQKLKLLAPASDQVISFYHNSFLELEITREGLISAGRLANPQIRVLDGRNQNFDLYYMGHLGTVTYKTLGSSNGYLTVDGKRVLDSVSMGQAEDQGFNGATKLCGKLGVSVERVEANPITKSSFYSIRRSIKPTDLGRAETLYDPGTEKFMDYSAGTKVVLIGRLQCPQGVSVKY